MNILAKMSIIEWDGNQRMMFDFLTNTQNQPIELEGANFQVVFEEGQSLGTLYVKTNVPAITLSSDPNDESMSHTWEVVPRGWYLVRNIKGELYVFDPVIVHRLLGVNNLNAFCNAAG